MQLLAAIIIGVIAILYLGHRIKKQFSHIDKDPKCEDCPVPDEQMVNDKKKLFNSLLKTYFSLFAF